MPIGRPRGSHLPYTVSLPFGKWQSFFRRWELNMALQISEAELERIVRSVLSELTGNGHVKTGGGRVVNGRCSTVDEAGEAAAEAFKQMSACTLDDRRRFGGSISATGLKNEE